jgi:flagellar basal-body rod protein FlgB
MSNAIFAATSRYAEWLAVRRVIVADNVAHASTPGFQARTVAPFRIDQNTVPANIQQTHQKHMSLYPAATATNEVAVSVSDGQASHSGNTVDLEREMASAGEVARGQALNVALTRSFHRMVLLSVRG